MSGSSTTEHLFGQIEYLLGDENRTCCTKSRKRFKAFGTLALQ
jgi:hypothetical protein